MTDFIDVSDTTPRIGYTATASQTAFTVPFVFFSNDDLTVYQNDVALVLDVHYTVSGAESETGGTVTLTTGATVGDAIEIVRHVARELTTHIPASGPLDIAAINVQFSKLVAMVQELGDDLDRALRLPDSVDVPGGLSTSTPVAGEYLLWNATGDGIESTSIVTPAGSYAIATQSEAEAGASNTTLMTPLRSAQLLRSSTVVSVREFGVVGDNTTDNYADIAAAVTYAVANGVTLGFGDGTYKHSGTNVFGYEKLRIHALGSNVVLKHTGTGVGNQFSGIALYPATQGAAGGVFGGPNRFLLEGNASTTNLVLVDNWHFGDMKIAGKNATNAILLCQDSGIVSASAVATHFDVKISTNISGAFTTVPLYGIRATSLAQCTIDNMLVEFVGSVASSSTGVSLVGCIGNTFKGGAVESCLAGGIALNSACTRNTFIGVDAEVNGTQQDWTIQGDGNLFLACSGAGTTAGQYLSGNYNEFILCKLQSMTIIAGATENKFDRCLETVAWTDGGTRTSIEMPRGGLATAKGYRTGAMQIASTTAIAAGGSGHIGYLFSSTADFGVYFGSGVPAIAAAKGSIYLRSDGTGTTSRAYVATDSAGNWTYLTAGA